MPGPATTNAIRAMSKVGKCHAKRTIYSCSNGNDWVGFRPLPSKQPGEADIQTDNLGDDNAPNIGYATMREQLPKATDYEPEQIMPCAGTPQL